MFIHHHKLDSVGNLLPSRIFITAQNIDTALTISTFLDAVNVAIANGEKVIYDAKSKTAGITQNNGYVSSVSHC